MTDLSSLVTIKDIVVAMCGLAGGYLTYRQTIGRLEKKKQPSDNVEASDLKSFKQISLINSEVQECFARTTAERFLVLLFEKEKNLSYVTAIYEMHKFNENNANMVYGLVNKYVKLKLDAEYELMIREVREKGVKKYSVDTMPEGMLKRFYVYENVTHSNIYFLYEFTDGNMLFYSIAKHEVEPFTATEETSFSLMSSKISQISLGYKNED